VLSIFLQAEIFEVTTRSLTTCTSFIAANSPSKTQIPHLPTTKQVFHPRQRAHNPVQDKEHVPSTDKKQVLIPPKSQGAYYVPSTDKKQVGGVPSKARHICTIHWQEAGRRHSIKGKTDMSHPPQGASIPSKTGSPCPIHWQELAGRRCPIQGKCPIHDKEHLSQPRRGAHVPSIDKQVGRRPSHKEHLSHPRRGAHGMSHPPTSRSEVSHPTRQGAHVTSTDKKQVRDVTSTDKRQVHVSPIRKEKISHPRQWALKTRNLPIHVQPGQVSLETTVAMVASRPTMMVLVEEQKSRQVYFEVYM
jgi:hypothetical protein